MSQSKPKYYFKAFCIFYFLLVGIMAFYFIKVLELKKKEINRIAHDKVDALTETSFFKQITLKKESEIYNSFLDVLKNKTTIDSVQNTIALNIEKNSHLFTQKTDSVFKNLNYDVAVRFSVKQITLNSSAQNLLKEPITILETTQKVKKPTRINTSEWEINESSSNKNDEECLDCPEDYNRHFTINQETHIEVLNIYRIALKELFPLLAFSVLICLFILILYYITYKTIRQKEREVLSLHNMVDNVSHEFKLPIATLKYGCNNLSKEYKSPTVELLLRQINRLEKIQQQLIPSNVQNSSPFSSLSFDNMIHDLQLHYTGVTFYTQWNADETLSLPNTPMETIILNLLENSVKYGATEITCHITQHSNSILLMVKDNGLGIEKEEQKLIFKKFYRIINNNVHTTTGLGIGLYQVQQIVQQLNGNIELLSKINTGTTFKISLPYA
ncbi:sensor histidine kinase [Myroides indicus]|uniref:histidine kinase n=1 Tax=Myroides indicus TaxID=1323422 RepID=A0A4R7F042_9FLAO|nr:HAMP domain-containing sensor histidine kinase [Myroides indicus]TDS56513.1 two-component system phosphate regulon sensor histidine kinase PhoR [Myroides indicus]